MALDDRKDLLQAHTPRHEEWQHQREQEVGQEQCIMGPAEAWGLVLGSFTIMRPLSHCADISTLAEGRKVHTVSCEDLL